MSPSTLDRTPRPTATGDPALARRVLDAAGDLVGRRVLDVGCGSGELAAAAAALGGRVAAMDACPEILGRAARGAPLGVELVRADGQALPFRDGAFDLATSVLVLHSLPGPARALSEIFRVLRPGGRLVLADRITTEDGPDRAEHLRIERLRHPRLPYLHTAGELERFLRQAGFSLGSAQDHTWTLSLERWLRDLEEGIASEIRDALAHRKNGGLGGIALEGDDTLRLRVRLLSARKAP